MRSLASLVSVFAIGSLAWAGVASGAPLAAASFPSCFGGTSASQDATGRIWLSRTRPGVDAGCDYGLPVRLDADHARVEVRPFASANRGYYNVTVLFFANGGFLGEPLWIADTQSTALHVLADLRQFASEKGIRGADSYLLRFRIQPVTASNPAFAFREVLIGPARMTGAAR